LIAARYPYFSAVQVLLARAYRDKNDYRYSGKLQQAAVVSNNRRQLFELVRTRRAESIISQEIAEGRPQPPLVSVKEPAVPKVNPLPEIPIETLTPTESTPLEVVTLASPSDRDGLTQLADVIMSDESVVSSQAQGKPDHTVISISSQPVSPILPVEPAFEEKSLLEKEPDQEIVAPGTVPLSVERRGGIASEMDTLTRDIIASAVSRSIELEASPEVEPAPQKTAPTNEAEPIQG
jgi:hypothetical protein